MWRTLLIVSSFMLPRRSLRIHLAQENRQNWSWRQLQLLSEVYVRPNWSLRRWWETRLRNSFTFQHIWIGIDVIVIYFCVFAIDICCIWGIVIGFILFNYLKPSSYNNPKSVESICFPLFNINPPFSTLLSSNRNCCVSTWMDLNFTEVYVNFLKFRKLTSTSDLPYILNV